MSAETMIVNFISHYVSEGHRAKFIDTNEFDNF